MNKAAFKAKMVRRSENYDDLHELLGCTSDTVALKVNRYPMHSFNLRELTALVKHWSLTPEEFFEIFVNDEDKW